MYFFFFQAEDGIRDLTVTGVQTCAFRSPARGPRGSDLPCRPVVRPSRSGGRQILDRKSTRLNSSHSQISYAVFCLKKKKNGRIIVNFTFFIICACWRYAAGSL